MSSAVGQPFVTVSYDYGYRHTKDKMRAEDIACSRKIKIKNALESRALLLIFPNILTLHSLMVGLVKKKKNYS